GTLAVESGLAQLPPSFPGTSGDRSGHGGGRGAQQGQFRTRVVCAHSRDSSGHGWSVHTAGTVQDTGGQCAQQRQFRTQVVVSAHNRDSSGHRGGAHDRDSSGHGWSVRTTGTVQDTGGGRCGYDSLRLHSRCP
ncbi:unnamed protein product, partial [Staurois parvus]